MPQKIFAVLVGIDQYQKYPLSGCVNDIKAVEQWLQKAYSDQDQLSVLRLTDEDPDNQPHRQHIIDAFNHFDKATGEDICLFYYCGHGINLKPPAELEHEPALQALVCKDWTGTDDGKGFLIDKELSYLIWQKTRHKPDLSFVVITDCCHSGTITRDISDETEPGVRAIAGTFKAPPINDFFGYAADKGNEGYGIDTGFEGDQRLVVPSGRYLHFAAAQDDQKAYEITTPNNDKRGGFTYYLLDILEKFGGAVTYQEAFDYIGSSIRQYFIRTGKAKQQFPCFSASGATRGENIGDRIFFTKESKKSKRLFELYFDGREGSTGWYIDAGQTDGITAGDSFEIASPANAKRSLVAVNVFRDHASVSGEMAGLNEGQHYAVQAAKPLQSALVVCFDPNVPTLFQQQLIIEWKKAVGDDALRNVVFETGTNVPPTAPVIKLQQQDLYLDYKDNSFRLCTNLSITDLTNGTAIDNIEWNLIIDNAAKATAWIRLMLFQNKAIAAALPYRIHLKCTTAATENTNGARTRQIMKYFSADTPPTFQIAVENTFTDTLFISFAYLAADGSIDTKVFSWLTVEPGKTATMVHEAMGEKPLSIIPLTYEPEESDHNEYCTEYLKVFISKKKLISLGAFDQRPLAKQYDGAHRAIGIKKADSTLETFNWQAETICFSIQRKPSN
jgi:hypothetical protein